MFKISFYRLPVLTVLLSLLMSSCNFGPQPDKIVEITLELNESIDSNQEINTIIQKLNKRLGKIARNVEIISMIDQNQIKIKVATHYKAERIKNYILNPGRLDFYEIYSLKDLTAFFLQIDEEAKNGSEASEANPFFDLIKNPGYKGGPVLFYIEENDTVLVRKYISSKTAESNLPEGRRFMKFLWGIKEKGTNNFPLYALKKSKIGGSGLNGEVVMDAFMNYDQVGRPVISMQMNEEGAKKWKDLTEKAFIQQSYIAIVLNNEVYSAPGVLSGPIEGGRSQISGDFTVEQAQDFANILSSGAIPKMSIVSFEVQKLQ